MLGLLRALGRWDPDRGSPFVAYAIPTIVGELRRHYRDTGWALHVGRTAKENALRIRALDRRSDRPLTVAECCTALDLTAEAVVDARLAMQAMRAGSLSVPDDPDAPPLPVPVQIEDGYRAAEARTTIGALTRDLEPRERQIVALRFGADLTQAEIGARVGVSQMHVSRILRRVLDQLGAAA